MRLASVGVPDEVLGEVLLAEPCLLVPLLLEPLVVGRCVCVGAMVRGAERIDGAVETGAGTTVANGSTRIVTIRGRKVVVWWATHLPTVRGTWMAFVSFT